MTTGFRAIPLPSSCPHTGWRRGRQSPGQGVLPSVPGPESGWGDPLISLLLVPLQWGCLFGLCPVSALGTHKGPGEPGGTSCPGVCRSSQATILLRLGTLVSSLTNSRSWFPRSQFPSPLWAAAGWGAEGLAQSAVGRRRVVGAVVWAAAWSLQHAPLRGLVLSHLTEPLPPWVAGQLGGAGG